jgi:threonyl-tRNA synthetase
MLHRVILGAIERFIGVLIEHYEGRFPVWLAPIQAIVANITYEQEAYASSIYGRLIEEGVRVQLDIRNEKLGFKVREAIVKKVPYIIIVGKREMDSQTVTLRLRDGGELKGLGLEDFINRVKDDNLFRR